MITIFKTHNIPPHAGKKYWIKRENWAIKFHDGETLYGAWDKQDLINKVAALDLPDLIVMP